MTCIQDTTALRRIAGKETKKKHERFCRFCTHPGRKRHPVNPKDGYSLVVPAGVIRKL
jgi:hypothetical protein